MQIKIFTIPITGGELVAEELNIFLRSKKILQTESQLQSLPGGACWCFCIRYIDDIQLAGREKVKVDYMQVLAPEVFKRFSKLREIRKRIATEEAIPAYAIFTDEELAAIADMDTVTLTGIKSIKGIGEKRCDKYGSFFLSTTV